MFFLNNLGGWNFAFPNVCLTPILVPVPIPYPSIAISLMHIPSQFNIFIGIGIAGNLATTGTTSFGDSTGVNLGVASGLIMGPDRSILGSFKILIAAIPASRMTGVTIQNGTNAPGITLIVVQFIVACFG